MWNDRVFNNGLQLRILPLGASIVYGEKSSDGNGFRYGLRNQLVDNGNPVNFIGSNQGGSMIDNECEAWPGYTIDQVAEKAELSIPSQPNLVLLHVGTNDAVQDLDIQNAMVRLESLIDRLFDAIPGVTIIASTLLPNTNSKTQANIDIINNQIPNLVQERQSSGKWITYVDFASSYFSLSDLSDGTHPNDDGYLKMAEVWYQGIEVADSQGWLSTLANGVSDVVSGGSNTTCDKLPGNAIGPTQTQMSSGSDDGPYVHIGTQVDGFAGFKNPPTVNFNNPLPEGVFWADIDGDGIDDYVYMGSESSYGIGVALSLGEGRMGEYLWSDFSPTCNRPGINFADMTGDGRDDFCCIGPDGGVVCWQNINGSDPRNPSWVSIGTVKESEGFPQAQVRLADIDGDGRTDYVVFDAGTQNIYGWRNGALSNSAPAYWYPMMGVFTGLPSHDLTGWQFVDLNGDGKDDLIWIDDNGQVTSWINSRGYSVGLGPEWISQGVTHKGSDHAVNVTFGAFMGSGRADYALVSIRDDNVYVEPWENRDHGGTEVKGDGSRYCDMMGSGSDDYLFVDATGAISLYENTHDWGHWIEWGVIYEANRVRQEVHLADFDGDGKCDILLVDKASGATRVIQNGYDKDTFTFEDIGVITGSAHCPEGYGQDKHDLGVRWNDLTGDGRADFLCVQSDGTVTGYINKGVNDFVDQGLIKSSEGRERKNVRFVDINGDGRDDYVYVNMTDGAVTVWYNDGWTPNTDDVFQWRSQGIVSPGGFSRGASIEFGALNGLNRADYISVRPSTNEAWTWFNICPDGEGPAPPNLPSGAPPAPTVGSVSSPSFTTSISSVSPSGDTSPAIDLVTTTFEDSRGSTSIATITATPQVLTSQSDTIVPTTGSTAWITTATDSVGSIILGTISQESIPTTLSTIPTSLVTYTEFPSSVSFDSTSVSFNTHDPEGHPVLAPWPACWFCPPGTGGFKIVGIPGPGVFPPPSPPPAFSMPFPTLTIGPEGDPTYEPPPKPTNPSSELSSQSSETTSKSCSTETVTQTTYYVSYSTDDAGSTVATATTSTESSELAGCSITAAVATSTTVGGYPYYCAAEACSGCKSRRDSMTEYGNVQVGDLQSDVQGSVSNFGPVGIFNLTERDIPMPTDSVADVYQAVRHPRNKDKLRDVEHDLGYIKTQGSFAVAKKGLTSSRFEPYLANEINILVQGLRGCTSIMVVSRQGAWASHMWESPGFTVRFQEDVIDYMLYGRLNGEANTQPLSALVNQQVFGDQTTRIFIMTPATIDLDLKENLPGASLTQNQGDNIALFGPQYPDGWADRLTPLNSFLGSIMPNVPIDYFVYRRETGNLNSGNAFGSATIVYSNDQGLDDDYDDLPPPPKATWACYMQGKLMGSDRWDASPAQGGPSPSPSTTTSTSSSTSSSTPSSSPTEEVSTTAEATSATGDASATSEVSPSLPTTISSISLTDAPWETAIPATQIISPGPLSPFAPTSGESPSATSTSSDATSTGSTHLPLPTITDIVKDSAYCFTPNDGDYVRFSREDGQVVVSHFCTQNPVLDPSNKDGVTDYHTDVSGTTVHISARWADDQTGCEPIQYIFPFTDPEDGMAHDKTCLIAWDADYYCDQGLISKTQLSYGGGFILNTPVHGCIEFKQWAKHSSIDEVSHITMSNDKQNLTFGPITLGKYDGRYGNFSLDDVANVPHLFDIAGIDQ